jgi:lipopolysaccharide transport system ATP-binding protein
MNPDYSIEIEDLSKTYRVWHSPAARLRGVITGGGRDTDYTDFFALQSLNLRIKRGESVGIVGKNGSGKSTLLQMIAGTLTPTAGTIKTSGRIGALLELGSGFNTDFTGRENVLLNASIFGMTQAEVEERMDDILSFADIGPYIDLPIKTYSSGMVVRLAFAVQIMLDPEILIVDEALSVGDEAFQKKCFGRLETLKESGVTLLFVTHAADLVLSLCDQALLLHAGRPVLFGKPKGVVNVYHRLLYDNKYDIDRAAGDYERSLKEKKKSEDQGPALSVSENEPAAEEEADFDPDFISESKMEYASLGATISNPRIEDGNGRVVNQLIRGHEYAYCYEVDFQKALGAVRFGCLLRNRQGVSMGGMTTAPLSRAMTLVEAGTRLECRFVFTCRLTSDTYFFNAGGTASIEGEERFVHRIIDAVMFRVKPEEPNCVVGPVDLLERVEIKTFSPLTSPL